MVIGPGSLSDSCAQCCGPAARRRRLADGWLDPAATFAADLIDHDRRLGLSGWVVVLRPVERAECRLERGEQADDVGSFEVLVCLAEVFACHAVVSEEVRRRDDRDPQPVDGGPCGFVLDPQVLGYWNRS